jgi:hypothetical protein
MTTKQPNTSPSQREELEGYYNRMDALIRILGKNTNKDVWSLMTDRQKIQLEHLISQTQKDTITRVLSLTSMQQETHWTDHSDHESNVPTDTMRTRNDFRDELTKELENLSHE